MKTLLVTGGAGFIGGNFVLGAVADGLRVVNLDKLTYAGNLDTLLALKGLKVAARFEWIVVVLQYVVLLLVAAAGIAALVHSTSAVAFSPDCTLAPFDALN